MTDVRPSIEHVDGFRVAGVHAGLKKDGRLDFALVVSDTPCVTAGVFTTNRFKAAPVLVDMERLAANPMGIRAVAINTRCANASTGEEGVRRAKAMGKLSADALSLTEEEVLVLSTGVIGTQLPLDKIEQGVELAAKSLGREWYAAAAAIMTTDTRPKLASVTVARPNGQRYEIAGIAKGAGMIAPNMATMLAVVVTDAALNVPLAQKALSAVTQTTFNRIVVDGDTSTNDTLLLLANGRSGTVIDTADEYAEFIEGLHAVCRKLAQDIVRDGEGATKFITIHVTGAPDDAAAHQIANTIATSPLVKTAFYGNDANWGRIMAAAGRAGIALEPERCKLWIMPGETMELGGIALQLFDNGIPTDYSEGMATTIVSESAVTVFLDCGMGSGSSVVWTCDLSHDYVSVNGSYRS